MSRKIAVWLIVAAALLLLGGLIFGGAMTMLKWDFSKLSTVKYETNEYRISEIYQDITVMGGTADLVFVPSENAETTVTCYEQEYSKHTVSVRDGVLEIRVEDARQWYHYIGIHFVNPRITVALPSGQYGALFVQADTGDVEIPKAFTFESVEVAVTTGSVKNSASASGEVRIQTTTGMVNVDDISAGSLAISVETGMVAASGIRCAGDAELRMTTGKAEVTHVECRNFTSRGSTGRITMNGLWAEEKLSIERSTGDVKFDRCDAGEIFVKTDTGDVTGTLLTGKLFVTHTDTGRVKVPEAINGGKCQITTDTGDIKLSIAE